MAFEFKKPIGFRGKDFENAVGWVFGRRGH